MDIAEKDIMANVAKLIFAAAITLASITTPALAAHKTTPIRHVTPSSQGRGLYNFVPGTSSCPGLPYCDPNSGISYPGGEPGGSG
jgi:hypothetical protein